MYMLTIYIISAYIIFISIFAFDEFGKSTLGFLIHLIPSFLLIIVAYLALRFKQHGWKMFLLVGAIFTIFFKTYTDLIVFSIISLPLFVISYLSYKYN